MTEDALGSLARRYRLLERLGQGAMGTVWHAERIADGHRVALKLLKRELVGDQKSLHRFKREARLSSKLQHPNVVATLDAGVDEGTGQPWMALELVPGPTLAAWVQEQGAPPRHAAGALLRDVFGAVRRAHELAIVHRDLKPENVLLELGDGSVPRAKVSDFGIAKGLQEKSWASTEAGLGTPLWTAPEQGRDGFVPSPRVDVWALGLIAYFVLTGKQYWRHASGRSSVVDLVLELERASLVAPSERAREAGLGERIPPGFDAWFARAVNRRAEERFADAGESWRALAPILGVAERGSSARRLAWMGVALVLLLLGVLVVVLR
ncbi:MAG: serine/threonine protein kinase [Myxococcales bacterium]|nr:serine/threonine protein kinase [Myxococcales bacterium]